MFRHVKAAVAASVIWVGAAGVATAITSYEGKDYSFNFGLRHITACDKESDSTPVKGVYDDNNSGNGIGDVKDSSGNDGRCASENTTRDIDRHKTCEYRSFWPDACGSWRAT